MIIRSRPLPENGTTELDMSGPHRCDTAELVVRRLGKTILPFPPIIMCHMRRVLQKQRERKTIYHTKITFSAPQPSPLLLFTH